MTVTQLRQFPGFENVSDEEAREIIRTLQSYSEMMFRLFSEKATTAQRKAA
jgi:hypothetical protein